MDDVLTIAREWGSWAGAALAIAIALRTHATSSARTVEQLRKWLVAAQREIRDLRARVEELTLDRNRLALEVERLMPFEARASSLARELRELRGAITSGGGAHEPAAGRGLSLVREPVEAEVIQLRAAAQEGDGE